MSKIRSTRWFVLGAAVIIAACQGEIPGESATNSRTKPAYECIEGCQGPDLDIAASTYGPLQPLGSSWHGDTLWLPDSTYYTPGNNGFTILVFFDVGPNPADTTITVGTSIGASCSNECIFPTTLEEPTEGTLIIDGYSSITTYGGYQTKAPGDGYITFSAGAGEVNVKVHVYHCTYRITCG